MELKEIQELQKKFSLEHFAKLWEIKNQDDYIHKLQYLVVGLAGEVGEFANIVKKISRDHETLSENPSSERMENLKEELTDCFFYVLITANFLNIDLETEWKNKMEFNRKRFEKYKK